MTDPKPSSHKSRLLDVGTQMIHQYGFNGTSVDSILVESAVPKGSFYHHFGSKQTFGLAVLERHNAEQRALIEAWAAHDLPTALGRVTGYHRQLVDEFVTSGWKQACLTGKLSNELAVSSPVFRDQLAASYQGWVDALAALIAAGQADGSVRQDVSADELSAVIVVMIEGSFAAAVATQDRKSLEATTLGIADLLEARS